VTIRHISNGKPQTVQVRLAAKRKTDL